MNFANEAKKEFIHTAWELAAYYIALQPDGLIFMESPEDQGLTDEDEEESLIRLFLSEEDASIYCDMVNAVHGDEVRVDHITIKRLWELLPAIDGASKSFFKCPVRGSFCSLDSDGWPVEEDSLFAEENSVH